MAPMRVVPRKRSLSSCSDKSPLFLYMHLNATHARCGLGVKHMSCVVVKVGSSSLSNPDGGLDLDKLQHVVDELAELYSQGVQLVLVSSGAVSAGFKRLGLSRRPRSIVEKQAAAAVGQGLLIEEYTHRLLKKGITAAQILLTRDDFRDRARYVNAAGVFSLLLRRRVLPIVNENDTVAVDELTFGDNDRLSASVAAMVKADLLVLLTDMDGLYDRDPRQDPEAKLITDVPCINEEILQLAGSTGSELGTGGMASKLEAAKMATSSGIPVFLGNALRPRILVDAYRGQARGTYFSTSSGPLPSRKYWLKYLTDVSGEVVVDQGAAEALLQHGKSLLSSGIQEVSGSFQAGEVVAVKDQAGALIAKGVVRYSSQELSWMKGKRSFEIGPSPSQEVGLVIHRDQLVLMRQD